VKRASTIYDNLNALMKFYKILKRMIVMMMDHCEKNRSVEVKMM